MLTKKQLEILKVFKEDIFRRLTFKEIKEKSKQNSNNLVLNAVNEFKKEGLIEIKKTGNVRSFSLNLKFNPIYAYLNIINEETLNKSNLPKKTIQEIQDRIFKHTKLFILLVFGSYAKREETKKSDLDIAVIVENENAKKEIAPYIETVKRREILEIDYYIFTEREFIEMLKIEQQNVGKEIYRANFIYYGLIQYYNLIGELQNEYNI